MLNEIQNEYNELSQMQKKIIDEETAENDKNKYNKDLQENDVIER